MYIELCGSNPNHPTAGKRSLNYVYQATKKFCRHFEIHICVFCQYTDRRTTDLIAFVLAEKMQSRGDKENIGYMTAMPLINLRLWARQSYGAGSYCCHQWNSLHRYRILAAMHMTGGRSENRLRRSSCRNNRWWELFVLRGAHSVGRLHFAFCAKLITVRRVFDVALMHSVHE